MRRLKLTRVGLCVVLVSTSTLTSTVTAMTPPTTTTAPPSLVADSIAALQQRARVGTAKNGIRLVTLASSQSPLTVAVLGLRVPAGEVWAAMPWLVDVAARVLGTTGRVELTVGPAGTLLLALLAPSTSPELSPVRAADAVLKAMRTKAPALPSQTVPYRLDAGFDAGVVEVGAPSPTDQPAVQAAVQRAQQVLASLAPEQVSLAVVGPGTPDDLARRSAAALAAPLTRSPSSPSSPSSLSPSSPPSSPSSSSSSSPSLAGAEGLVMARPSAPVDRVALRVLATLAGGRLVEGDGTVGLSLPLDRAAASAMLRDVGAAAPPAEVVAAAVRREQHRALSRLDDVASLAARAAVDLLEGLPPHADLVAAVDVTADDVSRLARTLLQTGTPRSLPAPPLPAPPSLGPVVADAVAVVDAVDVLPWAAGVLPGGGPWAAAGPCGVRRGVGMPSSSSSPPPPSSLPSLSSVPIVLPMPSALAPVAGAGLWLPLAFVPGLFEGEGEVLALAVDAALSQAKVATTGPASLRLVGRAAFVHIPTAAAVSVVGEALRRFVPEQKGLAGWQAAAAARMRLVERQLGLAALRRVDRDLCFPPTRQSSQPLAPLSPAAVRAALAAPLRAFPGAAG